MTNPKELVEMELRRGRRVQESDLQQMLEENRVTPKTELAPMEHLFTLYDKPCFYRGELVADCGKAKSGKTFLLSILMACAVKGEMLALKREGDTPLKILWIDTEQSKHSTQDIQVNRIIPLAGVDGLSDELFFAFNLRGMGYDRRRKLVEFAICQIQPDLVILDGIKDLVTDINDAVQATMLMEQLMSLAQSANCCIVNVLHQNKSEADHNMRGSIGTELTNKAFEVFQCEYSEETDTFKVKHALSRKFRVKRKMYYTLDEKGLPQECDTPNTQPRDAQGRWISTKQQADQLQETFKNAMEGRTQRPYAEVMAVAMKKCGFEDAKTYYAAIDEAVKLGIIRTKQHPDTGATWVELLDNSLPF